MMISKLELQRFIQAYEKYKKDNEYKESYFKTRDYLEEYSLYDELELIESLVDYGAEFDKIVKAIKLLGVEVV